MLLVAYSLRLLPTSSCRPGKCIAIPVVLERSLSRTVSYWLPCGAPAFLLASPILLVFFLISFFPFLLLIFVTCPFSHLLSTIHEPVTKTTAMRRLFFG